MPILGCVKLKVCRYGIDSQWYKVNWGSLQWQKVVAGFFAGAEDKEGSDNFSNFFEFVFSLCMSCRPTTGSFGIVWGISFCCSISIPSSYKLISNLSGNLSSLCIYIFIIYYIFIVKYYSIQFYFILFCVLVCTCLDPLEKTVLNNVVLLS